jgi:hypothetical protein
VFVFNQFPDIEGALLRKGNVYNGSIKSVEACAVVIVLFFIMLDDEMTKECHHVWER